MTVEERWTRAAKLREDMLDAYAGRFTVRDLQRLMKLEGANLTLDDVMWIEQLAARWGI